jgi:integrase/recombinase XerD
LTYIGIPTREPHGFFTVADLVKLKLYQSMKCDRNGQAKILTDSEIEAIFSLFSERDRAVFAICLYGACRISEALSVRVDDIAGGVITLRKNSTKGKKGSRSIPISPNLEKILNDYLAIASPGEFLFPGRDGTKPLTTAYADLTLRQACQKLGIKGVSTHSFRRTALTRMHARGVPLRTIQRISGHSSLAALSVYLEVTDENVRDAVNLI